MLGLKRKHPQTPAEEGIKIDGLAGLALATEATLAEDHRNDDLKINRTVNLVYRIFLIAAIPLLALSLSRIPTSGILPVHYFHAGMAVILLGDLVFDYSVHAKKILLAAIFYLIGVVALHTFFFAAVGEAFFILSAVLCTVFFGSRVGYAVSASVGLIIVLRYWLALKGIYPDNFGPEFIPPVQMVILAAVALPFAAALACLVAGVSINELKKISFRDPLTNLYNRRFFMTQDSAQSQAKEWGVYLIDIDEFKSLNDSYGHSAGDQLLIAIAKTLKGSIKRGELLARLGGEEFGVIRPWQGWQDARTFAEDLRKAVQNTQVVIHDRPVNCTISVGFSKREPGDSFNRAVYFADLACRQAKLMGKNSVKPADGDLFRSLEEEGVFIKRDELEAALENDELYYAAQSIVSHPNSTVEGFEALIRWEKSDGTIVLPHQFINLLYTVVRQPKYRDRMIELRREFVDSLKDFPEAYLSFNYRVEELAYPGAAEQIHDIMSQIKDSPERSIIIEINERAMANERLQVKVVTQELTRLRQLGYQVALDDFGSESSNLNRLQDLPIDIAKIDKRLALSLENSTRDRITVKTIADLMKSLGIKPVVEGVENKSIADILLEMGITSQQGYFHSFPTRPQEFRPAGWIGFTSAQPC